MVYQPGHPKALFYICVKLSLFLVDVVLNIYLLFLSLLQLYPLALFQGHKLESNHNQATHVPVYPNNE